MLPLRLFLIALMGVSLGALAWSASLGGGVAYMPLLLSSSLIAAYFAWRMYRRGQPSHIAWIWAATALIIAGATGYQQRDDLYALVVLDQDTGAAATSSLRNEVMLMRAWDGHFRAVAEMDGQPVGLLVDTGASIVLIRYDDAKRIGFKDYELNFTTPVTTASGRSFVAPVTFDRIVIGGIVVTDVKGAVAQPGELHTSLLGMSYIEKLHEAVFRSDRLLLRY